MDTTNITSYTDLTKDNVLKFLIANKDTLIALLTESSDIEDEDSKDFNLEEILDEHPNYQIIKKIIDESETLPQDNWSGGEGGRINNIILFLTKFDNLNIHIWSQYDSWDSAEWEIEDRQLKPVNKVIWQ